MDFVPILFSPITFHFQTNLHKVLVDPLGIFLNLPIALSEGKCYMCFIQMLLHPVCVHVIF